MTESTVRTAIAGDVGHLILNRPSRRNAVSRALHHEVGLALRRLTTQHDIRFIVLRGAGGTFSSGGDLAELSAGLPPDYISDYWRRMEETVLLLRAVDQTVIAAVEGPAVGAGAALALAADIVVAEHDARFRFNFVHLGLLPDAGTTYWLPRLIGQAVARDLMLTGRWIDAREAHARGLIARVVPAAGIEPAIDQVLDELRAAPAPALALAKNLIDSATSSNLRSAVRAEGVYQQAAASSGEYLSHVRRILSGTTSRSDTMPVNDGA